MYYLKENKKFIGNSNVNEAKSYKQAYNLAFGVLSCIGIFCVVMGHMGCDLLSLNGWLPYASFHMPLFFFISGYFYNYDRELALLDSVVQLIKKLIVPFYLVYMAYYFLYLLLNRFWGCTIGIGKEMGIFAYIAAPFTGVQPVGFCTPAWFVITLFGVMVFHLCLQKLLHVLNVNEKETREYITVIIYIILGVIAFKTGTTAEYGWVKNILKIIYGLSFYQIGYLFHKYLEKQIMEVNIFVYFGILIVLREFLWIRTGWASIAMYSFSDIEEGYFAATLSAIIGILFWYRISVIVSKAVKENGFTIFIGKHTFSIMIHHLFTVFVIQGFILFIGRMLDINFIFDTAAYKSSEYFVFNQHPLIPVLLSILTVILIVVADCVVDRIKRRIKKYE